MIQPIYLLDTSILIDILNGKRGRRELALKLLNQGAMLASCPTTITEVYAGMRSGEETKTERLLRSLKFMPLTWEISKAAGDLICYWKQQGRTFSLPDMTIAAIAISGDLVLVTTNGEKTFRYVRYQALSTCPNRSCAGSAAPSPRAALFVWFCRETRIRYSG